MNKTLTTIPSRLSDVETRIDSLEDQIQKLLPVEKEETPPKCPESALREAAIEIFQAYIIAGHEKYLSTYNDWINTGSRLDKASRLMAVFENGLGQSRNFWMRVSTWKDDYARLLSVQGDKAIIERLQNCLTELDAENERLRQNMTFAETNKNTIKGIRLALNLKPDGDVIAAVKKLIKRKKYRV